jgi:hypothetical protein
MVVILGNILGKYGFYVGRAKRLDVLIIANVYIIIPIGKLVMQRVPETNKGEHANCAQY